MGDEAFLGIDFVRAEKRVVTQNRLRGIGGPFDLFDVAAFVGEHAGGPAGVGELSSNVPRGVVD